MMSLPQWRNWQTRTVQSRVLITRVWVQLPPAALMEKSQKILKGNLRHIQSKKGWFMGYFVKSPPPFKTSDFEVKWGKHRKGEKCKNFKANKKAVSVVILIYGKLEMEFKPNQRMILEHEGDYVWWDRRVFHRWRVVENSLIITIRWPSLPDDQISSL